MITADLTASRDCTSTQDDGKFSVGEILVWFFSGLRFGFMLVNVVVIYRTNPVTEYSSAKTIIASQLKLINYYETMQSL